jgi:hypothetical protein
MRDQMTLQKGGKQYPWHVYELGKWSRQKRTHTNEYTEMMVHFTIPKKGNILHKAGIEYFKGMELIGSSEGTPTKPKISLLKIYVEQIIPAIENKVVARFDKNGTRQICIVK